MSDLSLLVRMFDAAGEATVDARRESETYRDYYDGKQYTAAQLAELRKRKQPNVFENLIRPKIESLRGLERQSRTDPKAYPRTFSRDADAFAATDALRYVKTDQRFDAKRSRVFENLLIEGYGGVEVGAASARGGVIDPAIIRLNWDRLFYDPCSSEPDFSDATYLGYITWMDQAAALAKCAAGGVWAGKEAVIRDTMAQPCSGVFDTYDDKPRWAYWADGKRQRIRVVTIYYEKDGVWNRAVYTLGGELEPCGPSQYLDEDGNPDCALVFASAFVDRDNDRYGIVRDMLPLQDEVNKRRGKFLHATNTRTVRVGASATQDKEEIRREASRPDGVIAADKEDFEVIPNNDLATGQFQLLQDTRASMKATGPNAYMQGKAGMDQSGRAILAQQQAGMTEMTPLLDALGDFNVRVYRKVWCRIRQYWKEPRWVRITDDESNARFVGFNVTKGHLAAQKIKAALDDGQIDEATARQYALQVQADPSMLQPANVVGEMDVDIDIEEVPESPVLQDEQFKELAQLASSGMLGNPAPPEVVEMIIRASSLRDKDKILQALKSRVNAPAQPPTPEQQLALRTTAATAAEKEARAALYGAKAHNEAAMPLLVGHERGLAA